MTGPHPLRAAAAIARAEFVLLRRNTTVLLASTGLPIAMTVGSVFFVPGEVGTDGWGLLLGILLSLVLGSAVYMTATLTLTARREDLYLKRLRTSEAGDATIVAGLLSPTVAIGLLQCAVAVVVITVAGGARPPALPVLLVGVLIATLLVVLTAVATTGVIRGTEQADAATLPFFTFLVLGAVWAAFEGTRSVVPLFLPGGAIVAVLRAAVDPAGGVAAALPGLGVLCAWCLLAGLLARRMFRWEPRR